MYNFKRKTNIVFLQIIVIMLSFFAVLFYIGSNLSIQLLSILNSFFNGLELVCGCVSHFTFSHHPFLFSGLFISFLILVFFIGMILYKFINFKKFNNKFIHIILSKKKKFLSIKLQEAIIRAKLKNKVIEIDMTRPVVFCFSFFRPKICISSKLVQELSIKELEVILLHEKMHIENKEPAKLFLVKLSEKVLFFIPSFKLLTRQYFILSELAADELATDGFKNKLYLVRALYKSMKLEENFGLQSVNESFASFFSVIDERISRLEGKNFKYSDGYYFYNFTLIILFISFIVLPFVLINNNLQTAKASLIVNCPLEKHVLYNKYNIFMENKTCEMNNNLHINYFDDYYFNKSGVTEKLFFSNFSEN